MWKSEKTFRKSDQSAYSIVPSRMSSRLSMSTRRSLDHESAKSINEMTYRRLSFEDDLFTARVYKRNYRNPVILQLFQSRRRTAFGETNSLKSKHEEENQGIVHPGNSNKARPFLEPTLRSRHLSPSEEPYTVSSGDENDRDVRMRLPIITITYLPDYSEVSPDDFRDDEQHPNYHDALPPDIHQQHPAEVVSTMQMRRVETGIDSEKIRIQTPRYKLELQRAKTFLPVHVATSEDDLQIHSRMILRNDRSCLNVPTSDAFKWRNLLGTAPGTITDSRSYMPGPPKSWPETDASVCRCVGKIASSHHSSKDFESACEKGDHHKVKNFLELGQDMHAQSRSGGFQALHIAVSEGHSKIVQLLLDHGASTESWNDMNVGTPLHAAILCDELPIVEQLLGNNVCISAKDKLGRQPIHLASAYGSLEIWHLLTARGATLDCSDNQGYQPLHCAAETSDRPEIIKFLVHKGADVLAQVTLEPGDRPIDLAFRQGHAGNIRILLALEAQNRGSDRQFILDHTDITFDDMMNFEKHRLHRLPKSGSRSQWIDILTDLSSSLCTPQNAECLKSQFRSVSQEYSRIEYLNASVTIPRYINALFHSATDLNVTNKDGCSILALAARQRFYNFSVLLINLGARLLFDRDGCFLCIHVYRGVNSKLRCDLIKRGPYKGDGFQLQEADRVCHDFLNLRLSSP